MSDLVTMHELVLSGYSGGHSGSDSEERPGGRTGGRPRTIVDRLSISIAPGESLALVGESGSGKSLTALALMGLLPEPSVTVGGGSIRFRDADLLAMAPRERRRITGREIAMVFQEPMTSLNPVMRAGDQIVEMIRAHERVGRRAATARAAELLASGRWSPSRSKSTVWATGERAGTGSSRSWRRWVSLRTTPPAIRTS